MNTNYPYCYLHNEGNQQYALSMLLDQGLYIINDQLTMPANGIHWIAFDGTNDQTLGRTPAPPYRFSMNAKDEILVTTLPFGKSIDRVLEQNKCRIHAEDASSKQVGFPPSTAYLPHLYMTKQTDDHTQCTMHFAIPASGRVFAVRRFTKSGDSCTIEIKEQATAFNGAVWKSLPYYFEIAISVEFITVEVYDRTNSINPRGTGTIRHSSADIKPFPLLKC